LIITGDLAGEHFVHLTGARDIEEYGFFASAQPRAQIDPNVEGGTPGSAPIDVVIDVNVDFFNFNFFPICDRSNGERYSASQCPDHQFNGTA